METAIDKHGWKILELLGIDTKLAVEATIHIKVHDLLTVDVTHLVKVDGNFVLNEDETEIEKVLKRYEFKEIKDYPINHPKYKGNETKKMADNKP